MKKNKIAILGAGHIAEKMALTLQGMEGVQRYAVAARELERAERFAAAWGFERAYGSYEELVKDPEVELVYIATPHSHHYEQARMCLMHNKAVLCEKAFTANARQAADLLRLAHDRGVFITEAIWTRYMPFSATLRELVFSGIIGQPRMLTASLGYPMAQKERIARPELCGGALLDIGVYPINFARMLFGTAIEEVQSSCVKNSLGVDMQDSLTFRYADGKMAVMQVTAFCANDRQGVISGDKGYIIVENINNPQSISVFDKEDNLLDFYPVPAQISGYEYEFQEAVRCIREGKTEADSMPLATSVQVLTVMDELRRQWGLVYPKEL